MTTPIGVHCTSTVNTNCVHCAWAARHTAIYCKKLSINHYFFCTIITTNKNRQSVELLHNNHRLLVTKPEPLACHCEKACSLFGFFCFCNIEYTAINSSFGFYAYGFYVKFINALKLQATSELCGIPSV